MPRYKVPIEEVRRIRRDLIVEAEDEATARERAEAGETAWESDDGRYDVVERTVAEEGVALISEHTYVVEQYLLYSLKYHVSAESEAEAVWKVLDEQVSHLDESLEYVEAAADYGISADDEPELCRELAEFDIHVKDVIPSIREITQIPDDAVPKKTALSERPHLRVILDSEPYGRECFDQYETLDEMLAAVKRLVEQSQSQFAVDGIERTVGIAVVPQSNSDD